MSGIVRVVVLGATLLSLCAALSATASAVTWHNAGNTSFHATGGAVTLSSTGLTGLVCPSGTATGTVAASPFVGAVWTAIVGTIKWGPNCALGTTGWSGDCSYALTASSWQSGSPAVTSGMADATCGFYNAGVKICHIDGQFTADYTNPVSPSTFGKLTVTTGNHLTSTNASATCPLGPDDKVHISEVTFTIVAAAGGTGTLGPIITRTS